ncbi:MAG TPA: cupin domain-containing protein [Prolixibacteraceae bacterium]|nr:cupin domain-containing protein [Prolixibacteraceae bacterium]
MEEQIRQIAERLRGLREVLDVSAEDAAQTCGISVEKYLDYESGKIDIPVSVLHNISQKYKVELTVLLTGEDPHMHHYSLTRKNTGASAERTKAYKYQSLAQSFINRKAEPFIVTVDPKPESTEICLNTHPGQEFNYILKGRLKFCLAGKEMILEEGDSIYFDSGLPHGMLALDGKECQFLALIF